MECWHASAFEALEPPLPSAEAGKQVFLAISQCVLSACHWKSQLHTGKVRLLSFRQTSRRMGEFRGHRVFRMEYLAQAVALEDLSITHQVHGHAVTHLKEQRLNEQGTLTFELTPAGWRGEDGNLY